MDYTGIKGIIFDYGGTLDSRGDHWSEVIRRGYEAAGVLIDHTLFREAYVYAERYLARNPIVGPDDNFHRLMTKKITVELSWLQDHGINNAATAENISKIAGYCYDSARVCVGEAISVLDVLSRDYPMALVSNFYGNVNAVLSDFGLLKYFPTVIESAVVGVRKPDPEIFNLGVKALGLPATDILVVGDSLDKDILPAQSLGCHTAWLKGIQWDEKPQIKANTLFNNTIISNITDLLTR